MPSIKLMMSQTRYGSEDALVRVTIPGIPVRDVRVAATTVPEPFVFNGSWALGSSVPVTVAFLNDKWDNTPQTDRNAFVKSVEVDGVDAGIARDLFSAEPQTFNVVIPGGAPVPAPAPPAPAAGPTPAPAPTAAPGDKMDVIIGYLAEIAAMLKALAPKDENVLALDVTEAEFMAAVKKRGAAP